MDDDELRELQDPSNWDYENAQRVAPVDDAGAVIAVRFTAAEFERVAQQAAQARMTLASFVRAMVLERVPERAMR